VYARVDSEVVPAAGGEEGEAMHCQITDYGFEYGAAKIERIASDDKRGWVYVGITTPKYPYFHVYITKTGKVRIFDQRGEWTPPVAKREKPHAKR